MNSFSPYHIVLVDDHPLVRRGIKRVIEENPEFRVVGELGDGLSLLEFLKDSRPQLVVMDLSMPGMGGIEATQHLKAAYPEIKVLVLTMHKGSEYVHQAMSAGAEGYLLKEEADTELHAAIAILRQGGRYMSPILEYSGPV